MAKLNGRISPRAPLKALRLALRAPAPGAESPHLVRENAAHPHSENCASSCRSMLCDWAFDLVLDRLPRPAAVLFGPATDLRRLAGLSSALSATRGAGGPSDGRSSMERRSARTSAAPSANFGVMSTPALATTDDNRPRPPPHILAPCFGRPLPLPSCPPLLSSTPLLLSPLLSSLIPNPLSPLPSSPLLPPPPSPSSLHPSSGAPNSSRRNMAAQPTLNRAIYRRDARTITRT